MRQESRERRERRNGRESLPAPPAHRTYCLVITTEKNPLLSPISLSFTPSISGPFAGILIGCVLDPIGKGALLPTRPISPPTGIAATGYAALLTVALPSGPAVALS